MDRGSSILRQNEWRIIDHSTIGLSMPAFASFAVDDALCTVSGKGLIPATARSWVHAPTIVLGIQDGRLPYLEQGTAYLKKQGYDVIVRNSGGLAVVLDEGILNLSLILTEHTHKIDIDKGYETMVDLVKKMFAEYTSDIMVGEVDGSYCPGSYDLSIGGKKIAGISQRRVRGGVAVQVYLCMSGSGSKRAELIRDFYRISKGSQETKFTYPDIRPEVMASINELLHTHLSIHDVMLRLFTVLQQHSDSIYTSQLSEEESELYMDHFMRIKDRNDKLFNR
ncbi:MAG: biotin/lipoate A/B protein ligase family protein [Bacillus sp. (in: firmicutes)]